MHDLTCSEVFDAAPQFALDILDPKARSEVAAHLIRCHGCRDTVTGMQESAAALLDLDGADWSRCLDGEPVPVEATPPADAPAPAARSHRSRIRLVVTLAAAALLMVGSTFGPEIEAATHHGATPVAQAQLLDGTRLVGQVNFYTGRSPVLDLEVIGLSTRGPVVCEIVNIDGSVTRLGSFGLFEGRGYWALTRPLDMGRVSSLVLVDGSGKVLASAQTATATAPSVS